MWPLLTTAAGAKFGKTEAGTVWLDPNRTSPFRFYQFWLNTDDRDVVRLLKFYTFMTQGEVDALARATEERPEAREAQRTLARTVTAMVHGDEQVRRAEQAAQVLFGGSFEGVSVADILMVSTMRRRRSGHAGRGDGGRGYAGAVKLAPSKSEAVRLLKGGGIYVNNARVADEKARLAG